MKRKYKSAALCVIICLLPSLACAETVNVPVNMEIQPAALDFEITEAIAMTASDGSGILDIDDLVIKSSDNNVLRMDVSDIAIEPQGDWSLVDDNYDFSSEVNNKIFSFVTDEHDFYDGSYKSAGEIEPGGTRTISFSGHVGIFTEAISEKAADMVVTIGYPPETFKFIINMNKTGEGDIEFVAEQGMTWGEWIESEYNEIGFYPCVNGGCHIIHPENYVVADTKGDIWVNVDSEIIEYRYHLLTNNETPK